ncbi:MAG: threonylcarbamoyl-AMP synthase [Fibrobacter sp.]|nr:threonylcarbamoyl-AMP synthase [Fibrobacter sp.]
MKLNVHPETPQTRWIKQALEVFQNDGVVAYPTDSGYAIGCSADSPKALKRVYQIKKPLKKYFMALLFSDFTNASKYAVINNFAFGQIKPRIPGPYTFILPSHYRIARLLGVKRPEVGCRWPTHPFLREILTQLEHPIISTAAKLEDGQELTCGDMIAEVFGHQVDLIIDCGEISINPTNIINMTKGDIEVVRGEWK